MFLMIWIVLVVLAPVAAEHGGRVFVLVQDLPVDGPDDAASEGQTVREDL